MTNEQTEKYKKEMMKFYEIQKKSNPFSSPEMSEQSENSDINTDLSESEYPDPELPEYITTALNNSVADNDIMISEASDSETYGNDTPAAGSGIIRAEVRTGNNALPVEDAFVVITRSVAGKKELVAALMTNKSGETISVNIPAPDSAVSQNIPFATVDMSTSKNGFQTAVNLDIPVYSGISSIQPVNLVPVPAGINEYPGQIRSSVHTKQLYKDTEES